jgi:hypothetical protein
VPEPEYLLQVPIVLPRLVYAEADEETEIYLRKKLAKEGIEPLGVIREERSISATCLREKSLDFSKETESAQDIIMGLEKVDEMYTR